MNLKGRVVLVTGAARRVGRSVALRLAEAGARMALHFNQSEADAEKTGSDCRALKTEAATFQADLADSGAPARLIQAVLERYGRLDVLINNAAVFERMSLDEYDLAAWDRCLRINLTAPMALTYAAREALRQARGRVINLCDSAVQRPWPRYLAYIVSKGGLETLTKALARALAPEVNVVGVAPGAAAWSDDYDTPTRARLTEKIPLKRAGTPNDVAAAVYYLLSEGDYVTGAILNVDGGRAIV